MKHDFQNSAALLNAFSAKILSDKDDWVDVADTMRARADVKCDMMRFVRHIPSTSFTQVNNLSLFPKMTYGELKHISQGTYQINQAKSYVQMHLKSNNNILIVIKVCDVTALQPYCQQNQCTDPLLLMLNLPSRFVSTKKHQTYVLFDKRNDEYILQKYCCSCRNGKRTIGCCSHVMTIIWYTAHIDHDNLCLPSVNFDNIFEDN